jgi:hypothetical protein
MLVHKIYLTGVMFGGHLSRRIVTDIPGTTDASFGEPFNTTYYIL